MKAPHRGQRRLFLLSVLLLLAASCAWPAPDELVYEAWAIPLSVVATTVSENGALTRKAKPGFVPRHETGQWDAAEFVKALGADTTPGAEATYDNVSGTLIVKNTQKNIAFLGATLAHAGLENLMIQLIAEISVYECVLTVPVKGDFTAWPDVAWLTRKAPKEVRLLDRISGTTRSGKRSKFVRRVSQNPASSQIEEPAEGRLLGDAESGLATEVECVVGPDEVIDTNLNFQWRGKLANGIPTSISQTAMFSSTDGHQVVIHVSALENSPGKYLVTTANLRLHAPGDWTLESLADIAKKTRKTQTTEQPATP